LKFDSINKRSAKAHEETAMVQEQLPSPSNLMQD